MTEEAKPRAEAIVERAIHGHRAKFGTNPTHIAVAPARVNLIGDHTDYNDGFAMPMAIDRYTVSAARLRDQRSGPIRVSSTLQTESVLIDDGPIQNLPEWARFVAGVDRLLREQGGDDRQSLDLFIESDVPIGSGLSSSAALCVSVATLLNQLIAKPHDSLSIAKLCQRVEWEFAGVPCGIMDQYAITQARPASALLLDCQSLTHRDVHVPTDHVAVLIADTRESRRLASGTYAERVRECAQAARSIGVRTLRHADPDSVRNAIDRPYKRARHVVSECQRVHEFAAALDSGDWQAAGEVMYASHASLRDDYEITGPVLDAVVEAAQHLGKQAGIWGARMTGAGLGGCAVVLVDVRNSDRAATELASEYTRRTGSEITVFPVRPVRGAYARALGS